MKNYDGTYSSTRMAFPAERFAAVQRFRVPLLYRIWRPLSWLLLMSLFGALGVLLAWKS